MVIVYLLTGAFISGILSFLYFRASLEKLKSSGVANFAIADREKTILSEKLQHFREQHLRLEAEGQRLQATVISLTAALATKESDNRNLNERLDTQKQELEAVQIKMKEQFENIANRIVYDNSQRIQQQHKEKLD